MLYEYLCSIMVHIFSKHTGRDVTVVQVLRPPEFSWINWRDVLVQTRCLCFFMHPDLNTYATKCHVRSIHSWDSILHTIRSWSKDCLKINDLHWHNRPRIWGRGVWWLPTFGLIFQPKWFSNPRDGREEKMGHVVIRTERRHLASTITYSIHSARQAYWLNKK